ncbi:serine protease, S1-C subfamily, contains C-terminal PDZ domain [Pedobacter westerhofensis]|uniref:Serine protease, S1-C subfamily, contains C-terminal PDZ domain n=1 Tax=Pedobacter westerhofensis TaxID=425512 RepID=A0A521EHA0_9SPHI|nr:trypsin-like peptidase domain-containing protein [Pedobacter westerhofensis]SMO83285.1 serine protease, S1-C subfamily, contains C-terminal PDZ domain [Pedobacter westerhofensis]
MKRIALIVFAAFVGGAAAIGGYKMLENKTSNLTLAEKQNVLFASNPTAIASTGAVDFVQAAAAVSPAVVHIKTTFTSGGSSESGSPMDMMEEFFGGGSRGRRSRAPRAASGSGVILTPDGYIVTNNHVVENAEKIQVILSDRRKVEAKVIGRDANTDLALIKVDATDLPVVKMGNSDNVQVGEWVLAVGFPLDLQTTVTAGIVSAKSRQIGILGRERQQPTEEEYEEYQRTGKAPVRAANSAIESYIQTDAAINPGNSGGALVNANGELVGINSAIASQTGTNEGYGFAIPVNLAKKILEDFKKYGSVKRGYVGVTFQELNADVAEDLKIDDISGLYVSEVMPNGGGAAAGIRKGDIIKKVEGKEVFNSPDLQEKIGRMSPGDKVLLTIAREGKLQNVNVTLKGDASIGVKPKTILASRTTGTTLDKLGATFAPASAATKAKYGAKSGVVVTAVEEGKLFDSFDISRGLLVTAVNGKPVNSAKDVEAALPTSRNGKTTISGIGPNGNYTFSFN